MQFEGVIEYLEKLIGLELESINESNDSITILSVDKDKKGTLSTAHLRLKKEAGLFLNCRKFGMSYYRKGTLA